jgi:hypothetical protein
MHFHSEPPQRDEAENGLLHYGRSREQDIAMPDHHHRVFVAIWLLMFMATQIFFIAEVNADSVMQAQCGAALWVLVLVRFIVFALEEGVGLVWSMAVERHGLVRIALRLGFAIAMTVVLSTMPGAGGGCSRALETAATVTHSYALLVLAWLAVVIDWIGFVSGLIVWCKTAAAME